MRRLSVIVFTLGLAAVLLSAPAAFAKKSKRAKASKLPAVKTVSPMRVKVGGTLTLRGKNFKRSKRRNTVIFRAPSGRTAFAKPVRSSRKKLVVKVPAGLEALLSTRDDAPVATRFKIRVLSGKFSKFTTRGQSPVIVSSLAPRPKPAPTKPAAPTAPAKEPDVEPAPKPVSCRKGGDTDGDLLSDTFEDTLKTNPCKRDSDGDAVEDGYEYQSSMDLNRYPSTPPPPYPGRKPYPNALDPSDGNLDYDGDGLSLRQEQLMWQRYSSDGVKRTGRPATLTNLPYSDGLQKSIDPAPAVPAGPLLAWALDMRSDGGLSDDERDVDNDGLGNWDEANGRFTETWWVKRFDGNGQPLESKYPEIDFLDNEDMPGRDAFADPDLDGDRVLDGADDHDHDGLSNQFEVRRPSDWYADAWGASPASNSWAYVQPFNPCKPFRSERCHQHPPFGYYDSDNAPPIGPDPPGGYPGVTPTTPDG